MAFLRKSGHLFKRIIESVKARRLRQQPPQRRLVSERVAVMPEANELDQFLHYDKVVYSPQSSNVDNYRYIKTDVNGFLGILRIEYKDGSRYDYQPVSVNEAQSLYAASSKGKWVWDHLRIRGTIYGYKVPYTMVLFLGRGAVVGMHERRPPGGRATGQYVTPGKKGRSGFEWQKHVRGYSTGPKPPPVPPGTDYGEGLGF
jgi:hypothetical protein